MPSVYLYIFLFAACIQLVLWIFLYGKYARHKTDVRQSALPASIVIAARNEASNLLSHLPGVLEQNHPEFEVIVVDDCSWDRTEEVLRAFANKYPQLKTVQVKETDKFHGGKKFALTMGIKAAKYDIIVLTDADCIPASPTWLKRTLGPFAEGKDIVLGFGAYQREKGLLNTLVRFDTFMIGLQYFSAALSGKPYMGVGRNLAWRKDLFFKNKGFATHARLASGDDDLFINAVANKNNTAICDHPQAHTRSLPPRNARQWFRQKTRHLSTWPTYRLSDKLLLGLAGISQYLFVLCFCLLVINRMHLYLILSIFACRILLQMLIFIRAMKKMNCTDLLPWGFVCELILMFLYPVFIVVSAMQRRKNG